MNKSQIADKAIKVIDSCTDCQQMHNAGNYIKLALKAVRGNFDLTCKIQKAQRDKYDSMFNHFLINRQSQP